MADGRYHVASISRQFRGPIIEMHMRRVHLTMRTEGITAFSNRYGAVVWTGENDAKTINVQIFLKTEQNSSVFVWKRISVDRALVSSPKICP